MELYNSQTMPLSNNSKLRTAQEKILRSEELEFSEKVIAGRDSTVKEINGYILKPDHVYRAISKEMLTRYQEAGMILGNDTDDEYMEYTENEITYNNNRGIDWYLGGYLFVMAISLLNVRLIRSIFNLLLILVREWQ